MNNPTRNTQKPKRERTPFFSEIQKEIFGYYVFTACMVIVMTGSIIAATFCLGYHDADLPLGGTTLFWRIPMTLFWAWYGLYAGYKLAEFWDPSDVQWVKDLLTKLRLR
jgi:hypothetical protein